ncbi:MAG: carboxypeptidase regulatory-like domain-containing protein [Candidatus Riflebacteria bacterium]|nr:carboxypeptidase regulatory-like domain-containing protein [Candidatus Riflebacteria bacterium]
MVKKFQIMLTLVLSVMLITLVGCGTKSTLRGSIVGTIIDSQTGIGIAGATVVTSPSTGSVITDINGAFSINDVNAGVYTVTAHASDFNSNSVTCSVDSGLSVTTNIVLVSTGGSFSRNILPIFTVNCAISGCHNDSAAAGKLRLNSYSAVMTGGKSGAVIYPFDSSTSRLVKRIKGTETPKMPLDRASLSTSDQGLISNWIAGGARNN